MKKIERVRTFLRTAFNAVVPSDTAWHGAAVGVYLLGTTVVGLLFATYFLQDFTFQKLPAYFVWVGASVLIGLAGLLVRCWSCGYRSFTGLRWRSLHRFW